jgi:Nickel responsive protein SCO4226-like
MPLFLIERNFAEELELSAEAVLGLQAVNDEVGVHWVNSFLSGDKRKTYCLYEAPSADAIREAARRASIPADAIVPVDDVRPEAITSAAPPS